MVARTLAFMIARKRRAVACSRPRRSSRPLQFPPCGASLFADLLLEAARLLFSSAASFGSTEPAVRRRVAELLTAVGQCTGEIAERVRLEKVVPQDRCFQLRHYCVDLTDVARPVLGGAEIEVLDDLLGRGTSTRGDLQELWDEYSPYSNVARDRDRVVAVLDEATGRFMAAANIVREGSRRLGN